MDTSKLRRYWLEILFYIIFKSLKPGGVFIFEPQQFVSYLRKTASKQIKKLGKASFKFHPTCFIKYLVDTYDFKLIKEELMPSNSKRLEQRKIYILKK